MDTLERSVPAVPSPAHTLTIDLSQGKVPALLNLVASAERGPLGFDSVHHRARVKPPARPTQMTLQEIFDWIAATPNQPHAIGEFQFIPSTLAYLIDVEHINMSARFTPALQRQLARRLLMDAGLQAYLDGQTLPDRFMDALAQVWAGLPLKNGQSAYRGIAGNRAVITRENYEAAFFAIFAG
jgi:hypothetical protein